jgi:deoxyribonuclease V
MFACLDASYRGNEAIAACILFRRWEDDHPAGEMTASANPVKPYVPGSFFLRELPVLRAVLGRVAEPLETVVIDGYVWLDDLQTPGLGAHLYQALGKSVRVIGVAKTAFRGAPGVEVVRGGTRRPLYVSAAGMPVAEAADCIRRMHGPYRLPTLIRRADALCRRGSSERIGGTAA